MEAVIERRRAILNVRAWRKRRESLHGAKPPWTSDEMWDKIRRAHPALSAEDQEHVFQEAAR